MELPQEYWSDRTLLEITGAIATPLLIDTATQNQVFENYVRVLIDIDSSRRLFHEMMVEREGFAFPIEVAYEWIPDFCSHRQIIGQHVSNCRWVHPQKSSRVDKGKQQEVVKKPVQRWQHKEKENPEGIGSSRALQKTVSAPIPNAVPIPKVVRNESQHVGSHDLTCHNTSTVLRSYLRTVFSLFHSVSSVFFVFCRFSSVSCFSLFYCLVPLFSL